MTSRVDPAFIEQFGRLPKNIQTLARRNYRRWIQDPQHPSLEFKRVNSSMPIFSVRIGIHYRALGVKRNEETILWFFIGSHAEYDKVLARL